MATEENGTVADESGEWDEMVAWQKQETEAHNTFAALARANNHCIGSDDNIKPPRLNSDGSEMVSGPEHRLNAPKEPSKE